MLANFLAASANAGKPVLAASLYKPPPKEEPVLRGPSIDEQFAVLRACFGIAEPEPVAKPEPVSRLNPNAPAWVPRSAPYPEPDPSDFALRVKWTKTKDANGKFKRVFHRMN